MYACCHSHRLLFALLAQTIRIQTWSTKYLVDDDDEYNATFVAAVRAERKVCART